MDITYDAMIDLCDDATSKINGSLKLKKNLRNMRYTIQSVTFAHQKTRTRNNTD